LVLDSKKIPSEQWRFWFAVGFAAVTLMFALSGLYAARAVVKYRRWSWPNPYGVINRRHDKIDDQLINRAAETLHDFAYNWEVADAELRALDSALRAFTVALLLLVALVIGFAVYQYSDVAPNAVLGPWR
jgi:membrane protein YdbS with pleckstrin-like domain